MKELYPIFKKDFAMKLRDMGNPIMDASTNKRNPNFVVYYFEDTDKLKIDLENISKENMSN